MKLNESEKTAFSNLSEQEQLKIIEKSNKKSTEAFNYSKKISKLT